MITFKPIELEDRETVQRYTLRSQRRNVTCLLLIYMDGVFYTVQN